jgi:hypothetical protein
MDDWDSHYLGEDEAARSRKQERDRPLTGCWKVVSTGRDFASSGGRREQVRDEATRLLLGDLLVTYRIGPDKWNSYSRRRGSYAPSRYRWDCLTHATVTRFGDVNTIGKLIEHEKTRPGQRGWQSRMRLSAEGAQVYEQSQVAYCPPESIILRDADKELLGYDDNDETRRMRFNLIEINEALAAAELGYEGRIVRFCKGVGTSISNSWRAASRRCRSQGAQSSIFDWGVWMGGLLPLQPQAAVRPVRR